MKSDSVRNNAVIAGATGLFIVAVLWFCSPHGVEPTAPPVTESPAVEARLSPAESRAAPVEEPSPPGRQTVASPPPQSEEARRARVLSQVWKVLRGAPQMPPDSADALAVLVAALFSDEIGLEPRDLPWLVEDFIAQAVALAGDDWQWGDDETRAVVAVRVFLGVVFQNRGDDAFARWVGDEVREELVATLLDTFDVLHENARAFLAGVLVDEGMLEGEAPAQMLRRLMELEPVPPSIARITRDTGVPAEVRTAVREGTDSWERFQARRRQ